MSALVGLTLSGDPAPWQRLGFATDAAGLTVGGVRITLNGTAEPAGIVDWTLRGNGPDLIDGLATRWTEQGPADAGTGHPNATTHLDHVVVMTPDLDRTVIALGAAGLEHRRTRETGTPDQPVRQAFFWMGDTILEVVGNVPSEDPAARFWGLVAVVADVDALAATLDDGLVGIPKDAVQPGRRILTVKREAGLPVPLAFLTPHVRTA